MSKRVNWDGILSGIFKLGFWAMPVTLCSLLIVDIINDADTDEKLTEAATVVAEEAKYTLVNADNIAVYKDGLTHLFNFDFGHVTVYGEINDKKLDESFTFDQFGEQTRIAEVKAKGCEISRSFAAMQMDSETDEKILKRQAAAGAFLKSHCPQAVP